MANDTVIEDARLLFLNFSGREDAFNDAGKRTFCVVLPPDIAQVMEADGWNVKYLAAREEGEEDTAYLPVEAKYNKYPPKITIITSSGPKLLTEDTVAMLDSQDFKTVDIIVNPYTWSAPGGKGGIKAYLKVMYAVLEEDVLTKKYGGYDDSPNRGN